MEEQTTKTLTIFTPAYNRAHTLGRTYESLCRQTCQDFEWLIIDDGSQDNTRQLVEGWIKENRFPIRYLYQENQGMHGAHNTAYRNIYTELNTCIDSDDYMPDDAVENIISYWRKYGSDEFAGLVGLDQTEDQQIIGLPFPEDMRSTTLTAYYAHGGRGDKKLVYRTEVIQYYPEYPQFEGERYISLGYKYQMVDLDYEMLVLNKPLVTVDYQPDGSSRNMYQQYWNNPKGFAFIRKIDMRYSKSRKRRFESCIHYVSSSIRAHNRNFLKESPLKICTLLALVPGLLLYAWTKHKVKTNQSFKLKL